MGFTVANHQDLPDKIHKDCYQCPRLYRCDEVPMIRGESAHVCDFAAAEKLAEDSGMNLSCDRSPKKFVCRKGFPFPRSLPALRSADGQTWRWLRPPAVRARRRYSPRTGWSRLPLRSAARRCSSARRPGSRCHRELRQCQLRHRTRGHSGLRASLPRGREDSRRVRRRSFSFLDRHHRRADCQRKRSMRKLPELIAARSASERGVLALCPCHHDHRHAAEDRSARFFEAGAERSHRAGNRQGRGHDPSAACDHAGVLVHRRGCECARAAVSSARGLRRFVELHVDRRRHFHQRHRAVAGERRERRSG